MALEFLQGGFNIGSLGGIGSVIWMAAQWIVGLLLIFFVFWKFILFPRLFKDLVDVLDITGGGIVITHDRGRWKKDRATNTGTYMLLREKEARLKHPPIECAIITKKGQHKYTFVKYGPGPFDYAVLDQNKIIENIKELPNVIQLADEDWAKHEVKKAQEKKTVQSWLAENKGTLITLAAIVIAMVIIFSIIGFAKETAANILATSQESSAQVATQLDPIAKELARIADKLSGTTQGVAPPPGF